MQNMTVSQAITHRHSTRAFIDKDVDQQIIHEILDLARLAPSGVNIQPWQVAVVKGETKQRLEKKLLARFHAGERDGMEYDYYPEQWVTPYKERRVETGKKLYGALNITRRDKDKRLTQWALNYQAFNAPVALFFFIDKCLSTGAFLDYGMFLQNIMLIAVEKGLGTCPQGALGEYFDTIKDELGYSHENTTLVGGMSLGYPDLDHPINQYRTERETVQNFTRFFD